MRLWSIHKTSKELDFPENRLRVWVKCGMVPGFYSGSRFLVDVDKFVEQVSQLCAVEQ